MGKGTGRVPRRGNALCRIGQGIVNLVYPPKCPFCGRILSDVGICDGCAENLPWTDGEGGLRTGSDGFLCAAPLRYEGPVRRAILRMKFYGGTDAADPLGLCMAACAAERFPDRFDAVTWVPISRRRKHTRGYDQGALLASAVCRSRIAYPLRPEQLTEKIRDNPAQSGLRDPAQRRANVSGVYALTSRAAVEGRRILLIDDVCTTGATLAECRRVLLAAGAASVLCLTAALAGRD